MTNPLKLLTLMLVANLALSHSTSVLALTNELTPNVEVVEETPELPHDMTETEEPISELEPELRLPELTVEGPATGKVGESLTLSVTSTQQVKEEVIITTSGDLQLAKVQEGLYQDETTHSFHLSAEQLNQDGEVTLELFGTTVGQNQVVATTIVSDTEVSSSVLNIELVEQPTKEDQAADVAETDNQPSKTTEIPLEATDIQLFQTLIVKQNESDSPVNPETKLRVGDQLAYELSIQLTEAARSQDKLILTVELPAVSRYQEGSLLLNGELIAPRSVSEGKLLIEVTDFSTKEQLNLSFKTKIEHLTVGEHDVTVTGQLEKAGQQTGETFTYQKVGNYDKTEQNAYIVTAQMSNLDFISGQLDSYLGNEVNPMELRENGRLSNQSLNPQLYLHKGQRFEVNLYVTPPQNKQQGEAKSPMIEQLELVFSDDQNNGGYYVPGSLSVNGVSVSDSQLTVFNDPLLADSKAYSFSYLPQSVNEELEVSYEMTGIAETGSTCFYLRSQGLNLLEKRNSIQQASWLMLDQVADGQLQFETIEEDFDFGSHQRTFSEQWLERKASSSNGYNPGVTVVDQRKKQADGWHVTASIVNELASEGQSLSDVLLFIPEGGTKADAVELSEEPVTIYSQKGTTLTGIKRNEINWSQETGIVMRLKKSDQNSGNYQGQIKWSLLAGP